MEKGETLKIFVYENFVVEGDPNFASPTPLFSMPRHLSPVVIWDLISVALGLGARPPTMIPFYNVRTNQALMI